MKNYLMICDEVGRSKLQDTFRPDAVQFLEVQGMSVQSGMQYNVLVTPILPPVNPAAILPTPQVQGDQPQQEAPEVK